MFACAQSLPGVFHSYMVARPGAQTQFQTASKVRMHCSCSFSSAPYRQWRDLFGSAAAPYGSADTQDAAWARLFKEYQRWRQDEIDAAAAPYLSRNGGDGPAPPQFNSSEWWACMISLRLKNMDLVLSKHEGKEFAAPKDCQHLPATVGPTEVATDDASGNDGGLDADDTDQPWAPGSPPSQVDEAHSRSDEEPGHKKQRFPSAQALRCGTHFGDRQIDGFHSAPLESCRTPEAIYAQEYERMTQKSKSAAHGEPGQTPKLAPDDSIDFDVGDATETFERQAEYFKAVDAYEHDPIKVASQTSIQQKDTPQAIAHRASSVLRQRQGGMTVVPSETVVIEAALFLVQEGVVSVRDVGGVSIKMGRALLWWASWLQHRMHQVWHIDGHLAAPPPDSTTRLFATFQLAIIGPGGTGKTTILLLIEALLEFFLGSGTVHKCALSNTAARLIGGDTLHALCKLPRLDLQERGAKLSNPVLKQHRARWRNTAAMFLDEISMVAPAQVCQADVRVRQATGQALHFFGGLGVGFSGDFLQLPPVEMHSLAETLDDTGRWRAKNLVATGSADMASRKQTKQWAKRQTCEISDGTVGQATPEARQGIEFWRSVCNVVSLTLPLRALGVLSRLLAEMRSGNISDEMWTLYESRILKQNDPRLKAPSIQHLAH